MKPIERNNGFKKGYYAFSTKQFMNLNKIILSKFNQLNFEKHANDFNIKFFNEMKENPNLLPFMYKESQSFKNLTENITDELFEIIKPIAESENIKVTESEFKEFLKLEIIKMDQIFKKMSQQSDLINFWTKNNEVDYGFRYKKYNEVPGNINIKNPKLLNTKTSILTTIKKIFGFSFISNDNPEYKEKHFPEYEYDEIAECAWEWQKKQLAKTTTINTNNANDLFATTAINTSVESGYDSSSSTCSTANTDTLSHSFTTSEMSTSIGSGYAKTSIINSNPTLKI